MLGLIDIVKGITGLASTYLENRKEVSNAKRDAKIQKFVAVKEEQESSIKDEVILLVMLYPAILLCIGATLDLFGFDNNFQESSQLLVDRGWTSSLVDSTMLSWQLL